MTQDELEKAMRADALSLLDSQISNLSQRVFEVGRQADRHLTLWITFTALSLLFAFGLTEKASPGGVELNTKVGATVTFTLSCVFYYSASLRMAALSVIRSFLRERRSVRYGSVLHGAHQISPEELEATQQELNSYISEFPGHLACSVLLKDRAKPQRGLNERYVHAVHYVVLIGFLVSPYALAIAVLVQAGGTLFTICGVILGLLFSFTGNAFIRFTDQGKTPMVETSGGTGTEGTPNPASCLPKENTPPDGSSGSSSG